MTFNELRSTAKSMGLSAGGTADQLRSRIEKARRGKVTPLASASGAGEMQRKKAAQSAGKIERPGPLTLSCELAPITEEGMTEIVTGVAEQAVSPPARPPARRPVRVG